MYLNVYFYFDFDLTMCTIQCVTCHLACDPPRSFVFVYVFVKEFVYVFVFVFVFLFLFDRVHYSMRDLLATPLAPLYANC